MFPLFLTDHYYHFNCISKIKKLNKRIVVGDVEILSEDKKVFCSALLTYSISNN